MILIELNVRSDVRRRERRDEGEGEREGEGREPIEQLQRVRVPCSGPPSLRGRLLLLLQGVLQARTTQTSEVSPPTPILLPIQ